MANSVAKMLACGGLAAALAAAVPSSARADHADFRGPPVKGDAYNEMLAAALPGAELDLRFSGPLIRLDPYNATLATAVSSQELYNSYAFAPGSEGPRVWESSSPFVK